MGKDKSSKKDRKDKKRKRDKEDEEDHRKAKAEKLVSGPLKRLNCSYQKHSAVAPSMQTACCPSQLHTTRHHWSYKHGLLCTCFSGVVHHHAG